MIVKAVYDDGSSKMVLINEEMNAYDVCMMLAKKNHQNIKPNWTLVERLEDFELGNVNIKYLFNYIVILHTYMITYLLLYAITFMEFSDYFVCKISCQTFHYFTIIEQRMRYSELNINYSFLLWYQDTR